MKKSLAALLLATLVAPSSPLTTPVNASSHREALAVLNEPCADNTDTYAWVSNNTHDKLYLIMNFNPLTSRGRGTRDYVRATATATSFTSPRARV